MSLLNMLPYSSAFAVLFGLGAFANPSNDYCYGMNGSGGGGGGLHGRTIPEPVVVATGFGFMLDNPCDLLVESATPTACNPADGSFDLEVVLSYATPPPTGNIAVSVSTGASATFPIGISPQTVTLTGLPSSGAANVGVNAYFEDDIICTDTLYSAYNEPAACNVCQTGYIQPGDVMQAGYGLYSCKAYNPNEPTLAVRDYSQMPRRYEDPANRACSYVDNSPYAPSIRMWNKSEFEGNDVMGVAFDHRTGEIYAATSYLYNAGCFDCNPAFEDTLAAKVYRISRDGNTVELFATIPGNKGTGWLDIDTLHNQLYTTSLDDGQIYAIPLGGGANQTGPFGSFGPYAADDLNEVAFPTRPDWNMAPLGQRTLGVGFNVKESRLYYSIWEIDSWNGPAPAPGVQNSIRSVAIDGSGNFLPATDVLEFYLPFLPYTTGDPDPIDFSMPVTDIVFSANGNRMLLAEQGFDSYDGWGGQAHTSRLLEYTGGTSGTWAAEPIDKYLMGVYGGYNSRGGASFAPARVASDGTTIGDEDFVIGTGDAVADYYAPSNNDGNGGASFYVDGAGFMPSTGSYSHCNVAGLDLDGNNANPGKAAFGDIDIRTCKASVASYDLALRKKVDYASNPGPYASGDTVTFEITVYNQGLQPATNVQLQDTYPDADFTLYSGGWTNTALGVASLNQPIPEIAPGDTAVVKISFIINAASGAVTNYAEVASFADAWGSPALDEDSGVLLGAGNDPDEEDNQIYGTIAGEDHDDLDFATISLGTVGIGNLVFIDNDGSQAFTSGEGVDGVVVMLLRPGYGPDGIPGNYDDFVIIDSMYTTGGGTYQFVDLPPGGYVVSIPETMFFPDSVLYNYKSVSGSGGDNQVDDDVDENGIDANGTSVLSPDIVGVSSGIIYLQPGIEPVGESGYDGAADLPDENIDFTVDFGFTQSVGIGNLVWMDYNGNGVFDMGEGAGGAQLDLYRPGYGPDGIAGNADDNDIVATTFSDFADGSYSFLGLGPGTYYVEVPAYQFNTFGVGLFYKATSIPGDGADNGVDDDSDENGLDSTDPFVDGVRSALITLTPGMEPTTSETGFGAGADEPDANIDFTVDFGFSTLVGIGNQVWVDGNLNGAYDAGEGVDGVTVELYRPGYGPDGIAGNADDDEPVQTTQTFNEGAYMFADYPGTYVVKIPASQFQSGAPLYNMASLVSAGGDNGVDDNADENGLDGTNLLVDGVSSVPITLEGGMEPTGEAGRYLDQGPFDASIDFTVDFAFLPIQFDLALRKTLASQSDDPLVAGASTVTFDIWVFNQGDVAADSIEITDYIPAGLTLADANWTMSGSDAVRTLSVANGGLAAALAPDDSVAVQITFGVDAAVEGVLTNYAEISRATDEGGSVLTDIDSTPDNANNETAVVNDEINDGGTNDEDDHDLECVSVPIQLCEGENATLVAESGFASYQWYKDGVELTGQTGESLAVAYDANGDFVGEYTYVVDGGTLGNCNGQMCCPIQVIACLPCPPINCVPIGITKTTN